LLLGLVCSLLPKGNLPSLIIFYLRKLGLFTPEVSWKSCRKASGVIILQQNGKEAVEVTTYSDWCLLSCNTCRTQATEKYPRERKPWYKIWLCCPF